MNHRHALAAGIIFLFVASLAAFAQTPLAFVNEPLIPTSIAPGHAAFTLTITGTGFLPTSTINWNRHPLATTFISSSELQATIPASNVAHKNTATISVTTPGVAGSNPVYFPVGPTSSSVAFARHDYLLNVPSNSIVRALAVADFNNDGKADIALSLYGSTIAVLFGNGDGTFQSPILTTLNLVTNGNCVVGEIDQLIPGDFNGDGIADLALGYPCSDAYGGSSSDLLYTAIGIGDGTFSAVGDGSISGTPVGLADLNADGYLDVLAGHTDYNGLDWFLNSELGNGTGSFPSGPWGTDTYGFGLAGIGDFNRDGLLDFAVPGETQWQSSGLYTFQGNGDGTFQSSAFYGTPGYSRRSYGPALVADLNGDGILDITTEGATFLGNGDGTFNSNANPAPPFPVALADLNNDNKLDIVSFGNTTVATLGASLGNGDGTFQPSSTWFIPSQQPAVGVADLNGDGRLDLVVAGTNIGYVGSGPTILSTYLQTSLAISTDYMNFGTLYLGTSASQTSTLTNIGHDTISLGEIKLMGWKDSYTVTNNCGPTLGPGASCTITAVFAPKQNKTLNTSIYLTYSGAAGSPQLISLLGAGYKAGASVSSGKALGANNPVRK